MSQPGNGPRGRNRKVDGTAGNVEKGNKVSSTPVGTGSRPAQNSSPRTGTAAGAPRPQSTQSQGAPRPQGFQRPHGTQTQQGFTGHQSTQGQRPQGAPVQPPFRPQTSSQGNARPSTTQTTSSSTSTRASSQSRGGLLPLIIVIAVVLLGGGGGLSGLFGGGSDTQTSHTVPVQTAVPATQSLFQDITSQSASSSSTSPLSAFASFLGGSQSTGLESILGGSWLSTSSGSVTGTSYGAQTDSTALDTSVTSGIRDRYTRLLGSGRDTVTLMIYMCGTDLESRSGMATRDIQEMLNASFQDNVRILLYTGGCKKWQNSQISSTTNQIWEIKSGKMTCLVRDDGKKAMTSPATLSSFIRYGAKTYPASRYFLVLWDHGGGSVSGYGYDETTSAGSMNLAGIHQALTDGGIKFDLIGYDACLMATVENALMLSSHADYLIASEESEPGVGWYYTDWLTQLGRNTSIPTTELGKKICDDFVSACRTQARGQDTTLSVVDLAELEATVPSRLAAFSRSISGLIEQKSYKQVSDARANSREFAASSRIDQVDLVDLALKMGNSEGKALADALDGAIKYNRSGSITNAYGLSVFFPYRKLSNVDKAVSTYSQIGMDESYMKCIRDFASVEVAGQAATGGATSPLSSIFGTSYGSSYSSSSSSYSSSDLISELLGSFLGGNSGSLGSLGSSLDFFSGRTSSDEDLVSYIQENHLDPERLNFVTLQDGSQVLDLTAQEWSLLHGIDQNVLLDDGQGYIDLGLDNVYSFNHDGQMVADDGGAWMAIDDQIVAYYHLSTRESGDTWRIEGYVPAILNGSRVKLIIVFDQDHEDGYIAGAQYDYLSENETVAKNLTELEVGDTLVFLCDYYTYDNVYDASYTLGNSVTVTEDTRIHNLYLPDPEKILLSYRFEDIYGQNYWSDPLDIRR
ncbi:MAG: peptidase C11 [Clostridia bacterium]|nr:peptidase C11 [Clostridia bacterium]